mgnify:CR=1 FL=1
MEKSRKLSFAADFRKTPEVINTAKDSHFNMINDNPLLETYKAPNQAPPFDTIKPEHFIPALKESILEAKGNIDKIKSGKQAPDFENTIVALESADENMGQVLSVYYHLLGARGGDDLHELAPQIGELSSNFSSDVLLDPELFERIRKVHEAQDSLELSPEQETLLEETYKGFVRGGALLEEDQKGRLREINTQMSKLGPQFMNNVTKSSESFEMVIREEKELDGLPQSIKDSARHAAEEEGYKGKWLFTLDIPSFLPFLQYASNRKLREKLWRGFTSRGTGGEYDNCKTILEIIALRYEKAQLMGYEYYADFILEDRMAESRKEVEAFLDTLKSAYKPAAIHDLQALRSMASELDGLKDIKPWDISYYSEKLKEKSFAFTEEDIRPYFQLDNVLEGAFEHFSKLFQLSFRKNESYPTWHKDVMAYDVYETDKDRFIGTFYADFYPRKGKKDGAWKFALRNQGLFRGQIERPIIGIVCNFTKPTTDSPSLLTHNEVLTLFHEMGHAVHGLVSDVTYPSLAGTSVKWDFVELPSQLQENWCFEKDTLDIFARHTKTGEPIPQDLVNKMVDAKNFMIGWAGLRQTNFATLDMAWHTTDPKDILDVPAFEDQATAETSLFPRLSGPFSASFSHIFAGGYAAGYYSYKWAEVLDADAFEAFVENGLYDQKTAQKYRDDVLAKGGTEHPKILYRRFRGRDADPQALLRREGLASYSQDISEPGKSANNGSS